MSTTAIVILCVFGLLVAYATFLQITIHHTRKKRAMTHMDESLRTVDEQLTNYKTKYPASVDPMESVREDYHQHVVERREKIKAEESDLKRKLRDDLAS